MQPPGSQQPPPPPLYAPNNGDFTFVSSADAEGKRMGKAVGARGSVAPFSIESGEAERPRLVSPGWVRGWK